MEPHTALASTCAELGDVAAEAAAYRGAIAARPSHAPAWIGLGVALSSSDDEAEAAEAAFRRAVEAGPADARAPLNLGRYLAKLSRPAEAIDSFYAAAAVDAEYFEEVKLGLGTARGQQGRVSEALSDFEAASRMNPGDAKLAASLPSMRANSQAVEAASLSFVNAVADVCGAPCQAIVDSAGYRVCAMTWAEGCGDAPAPSGFEAGSRVADMCTLACRFYVVSLQQRQGR